VVPAPVREGGTATRQASVADVVAVGTVAVVLVVAQVNVHCQVLKRLAFLWMSSQARACATRCLSVRLRMLALQTIAAVNDRPVYPI
jgi:hypothetical protein